MLNQENILAGWLIDGSGGAIRKDILLSLKDGKIADIRKAEKYDLDGLDIADNSECTIIPCLVDSHVHLSMSGTCDRKIRKHQLNAVFDDVKNVIATHLNMLVSYGVLAVRDGGDSSGHAMRYKNECQNFQKNPVRINVAGKAWRNHGRYGKLIGRPPSGKDTLAKSIAREKNRIDHIKIVNSGLNSLKEFGKETSPQFSISELREAVAVCDSLGLGVMVHANGKLPVRIALAAGCKSIEHGFFMGKANLEYMAEKKVFWVPTACTMKAISRNIGSNSPESDLALMNLDHQVEQISLARKLGVPIALGTDSGCIGVNHGSALIDELKLFMEAGFTIQEAVGCASNNGMKLLNLTKTGLLVRGMAADFIAVKGSPSKLPESLNNIKRIYTSEGI